MGLTRVYLALCVVAAHSTTVLPWRMHSGTEAVQIFFMISGFYMALIGEKYSSTTEFYASRFLRIFVPYYIVLAGILAVSVMCGMTTGKWLALDSYQSWSTNQNGLGGVVLATLGNCFIYFSDWTIFIAHEPNSTLAFTNNFHELSSPLPVYLFNPPAWSIAVELSFYLLVPWLNRRSTAVLVAIAAASLLARLYCYYGIGWSYDPWSYRFLPFEMLMFVAGMLSYRGFRTLSKRIHSGDKAAGRNSKTSYWLCILMVFMFFWGSAALSSFLTSQMGEPIGRLVSYVPWIVFIPTAFYWTKSLSLDRLLGELSYPIYLVHYFLVGLLAAIYTRVPDLPDYARGPIVAIISVLISILLLKIVNQLIEVRRAQLAKIIAGFVRSVFGRTKKVSGV